MTDDKKPTTLPDIESHPCPKCKSLICGVCYDDIHIAALNRIEEIDKEIAACKPDVDIHCLKLYGEKEGLTKFCNLEE